METLLTCTFVILHHACHTQFKWPPSKKVIQQKFWGIDD